MKKKAVFNWSGGKDSALALYKVLQEGEYDVVALLTTINGGNQRSSMHGIPVSLLLAQAHSIGIPLYELELPPQGEMAGYEAAMTRAVEHFKSLGVNKFIFGDIFLHDVRTYREQQLRPYGIEVVEPLWDKTTEEIIEEFLASGLRTIIVTTMSDLLNETYIGAEITHSLIAALPEGVDPCGENGEYHTFCFDGSIFKAPIKYTLGTPLQISNTVGMEDGTKKTFHYWYANLNDCLEKK